MCPTVQRLQTSKLLAFPECLPSVPQRGPGHQSQGWLDTQGRVCTGGQQVVGGTDSCPWTPLWPHSLYTLPAPFNLAKITGAITCADLLSFHHLWLPHPPCSLSSHLCPSALSPPPPIRFLFPVPLPWVTVFPVLSQFPVLVSPPAWPHRRLKKANTACETPSPGQLLLLRPGHPLFQSAASEESGPQGGTGSLSQPRASGGGGERRRPR